MVKRIEVIVPRRGLATGASSVKIEVNGMQGTSCRDATKALEAALGTVREYEDKAEIYEAQGQVETLSQGDA